MPSVTRRLARRYLPEEVLGLARRARSAAPAPLRPSGPARIPAARAGRHGGDTLVGALVAGRSLTGGLVAEVRGLLADGQITTATSIAAALEHDPSTRDVGALCSGLVAAHRGFTQLAWHELSSTPRDLWSRYAAGELVRAGVVQDWPAARSMVEGLVDEAPAHMTPKLWMELLEPVFGAGEIALAERIFRRLDAQLGSDPEGAGKLAVRRDWMSRWIERSADSATAPKGPGAVTFAVMDYDHPGRQRASANIGDHVQTLASLGHLVRHQDLTFHGSQDLLDLLSLLHGRVRPDRQRRGIDTAVNVLTVDRDASAFNEVPEGTWTLAFGWYMHALFGVRYGFPFHRNLLPIFVSFHCNKRDLLTPEAIDYLRRFGPVGCRDWTTVDILLSMDVPAFFSGCMTTTVNTVFPEQVGASPADAPVAYVDVPPERLPAGAAVYKHSSDAVRFRSFTANMFEAVDLLETYRRDHSAIVTSRLHCYLPMRSIGATVDFQPKNRSDIRFAGLIDITDDEFLAIQSGINDKLEKVFGRILGGADPDEVYALWRELVADDVERARRRLAAVPHVPEASGDLAPEIERAVAATRTRGGHEGTEPGSTVHVAVPLSAKHRPRVLNVLLESLTASTSRPLHVWLLSRSDRDVDLDGLARRFPGTSLSVVPTAGVGGDLRLVTSRRGAVPGLDVLLAARLVPDVDRLVVLPVDAVVLDDVGQLADLDLGGHLLAAPDVAGRPHASGFDVIHQAGSRLGTKTTVSTELRRQAHARHAFDFTAFDTAVLVLDAARVRADEFLGQAASLIEEFGLDGRDLLHMAVGPHRAVVPDRWHVVPTRSHDAEAALLHWSDEAKPWGPAYAPRQEEWTSVRRRFRERTVPASS